MLYFLPDSRDAIDPTYDFERETRSPDRQTRDDLYCHEVLERPCDGTLISYAAVLAGRYSAAARRRLLRSGAREFFRAPPWLKFMGDCGAFSYVNADEPPYTVAEVAKFYGQVGVDLGLAVDHIVPGFSDSELLFEPSPVARARFELTIALARDFLDAAKPYSFTPVGVVQGWSPSSFSAAARDLQHMGYRYLALGGLVQLKTEQVLTVLRAVDSVRRPDTKLHLLGVTRPGNVSEYVARGVASIDSTSPLRRAWMDARHNYWIGGESFCALRIPPSVSGKIRGRIGSGEINADLARELEARSLAAVSSFASGSGTAGKALEALLAYQEIHSPGDDRLADYQRTLEARPWERCRCSVCARLGHHVIVMRGAERNRSRGFHNVGQFYRGMLRELGEPDLVLIGCGAAKRKKASPARDLYTGSLFRANSAMADRYRAPVRILSAEHGLLDPAKVIEPYETALLGAPEAKRQEWGAMVAGQVEDFVGAGGRVVALAGARYLKWTKDLIGIVVEEPLARMSLGERLAAALPVSPSVEPPVRTGDPIVWDFFFTTFRSSLKGPAFAEHWDREGAYYVKLTLPSDTPLDEAIGAARATGLFGKGSSRTGVFEVQNDLGIYSHPKGYANLQRVKPSTIAFRTWAEIEAAESADLAA
jgi:hypothetical protein